MCLKQFENHIALGCTVFEAGGENVQNLRFQKNLAKFSLHKITSLLRHRNKIFSTMEVTLLLKLLAVVANKNLSISLCCIFLKKTLNRPSYRYFDFFVTFAMPCIKLFVGDRVERP